MSQIETPTMSNPEAIEMMQRCSAEIRELRAQVERLKPKAHAYELISSILALLPQQSQGYSEDLAWTLDKRIKALKEAVKLPAAEPVE